MSFRLPHPLVPPMGRHAIVVALLLVPILSSAPAAAQTVDVDGFVKASYYYDTRQIVAAREGDFVLYPQPENVVDGEDVNATDNLLFFPFFSRISFVVTDLPPVLGAEVTGRIEGDFHGASNELLNSYRLRRGFVKLAWDRHEALFGMEWSPTFLETWPRTAATEAGVPYHCFSRLPQARWTYRPDGFKLMLLAAQQRDAFAELSGLKSAQQAGLPMLMAFAGLERETLLLGAGAWTKWVRPTLDVERFSAMAYQGFVTWSPSPLTFRAKVTYGEDLADQIMTGGYVVDDTGEAVPLRTLAVWSEVETSREGLNFGLFGGWFSNLGADENVDIAELVDTAGDPARNVFVRGLSIDRGFRVAPRATYDVGRVRFALEVQIDDVVYASRLGADFAPAPTDDDESVTNVRTDFSVFLFF